MGRKFRKTEISGIVNILSNGQHVHANWFCINCHASGTIEKHYPECENKESYAIPSTAEVPRKTASKRIWDIFKNQFVFAKPQGWWKFREYCWWEKHR
jgi:hypothetical protein